MLSNTGERVIPDQMKPMNGLLLEHLARYHFAIPYCKGMVLDFACGSGYGSQLVAKQRKQEITMVTGLDINPASIKYAKGRYYHPKVNYIIGDVLDRDLALKLGSFDVILSFETIEHVEDYEQFILNTKSLLREDGLLILSTPFGNGVGKETKEPFHVHQFTKEEFHSLFDSFSSVSYYYQRNVLIEPPKPDVHYPLGIAVARK